MFLLRMVSDITEDVFSHVLVRVSQMPLISRIWPEFTYILRIGPLISYLKLFFKKFDFYVEHFSIEVLKK